MHWMRGNMANVVSADQRRNESPKMMMKFGYPYMIRGADYFNTFDSARWPTKWRRSREIAPFTCS